MRKKLSQKLCIIDFLCIFASLLFLGVLAHLARALDWQSKGGEFESRMLHNIPSLLLYIKSRKNYQGIKNFIKTTFRT